MRVLVFLFFSWMMLSSAAGARTKIDLNKIHSPFIKNETLYIVGKIDSHIYNYLAYEAEPLQKVRQVSLNSWGGAHDWSLEIARKIREMGLNTIVERESVCASACVYVFSGGIERVASSEIWLGIHGARLGKGSIQRFINGCFDAGEEAFVYNQSKEGCLKLEEELYKLSEENTRKAFDKIQAWGVSSNIYGDYLKFEDEKDWFLNFNFFRKPDWELTANEALEYGLATFLIE